jgi:hypothetical protein
MDRIKAGRIDRMKKGNGKRAKRLKTTGFFPLPLSTFFHFPFCLSYLSCLSFILFIL